MPHTVNSAIEEFKQSDEMLRLSKSSRSRHRLILDLLKEEAGPYTPVVRLSRADVDGVLADRRINGCTESTINAYKGTARLLGQWLVDNGYTKKNVAAHLKNVKTVTSKAKRKGISADQFNQMIKLAGARHPRDAATYSLLFWTGCRSVEIVNLTWQYVDWEAGTISVYRSKVKDWHVAIMPEVLIADLRTWESWYTERAGPIDPTWFVVPALRHRGFGQGQVPFRMGPDWPLNPTKPQNDVRSRVKVLLRAVGETNVQGRGAHVLRRAAAQLLLNETGDIRLVQHFLGHESVRMTERYLDVSADAARFGPTIRNWSI